MNNKNKVTDNPAMPSFFSDPAAALQSYRKLGYHIETGVWTPTELDALLQATEILPSFVEKIYKPAMHPHRSNSTFMAALKNPRIILVMEHLLGGKVSGIQTELFYSPLGTHGFARHQDNHYVEAGQETFASAWTALVDVTPHNGSLIVWPGTHREPILPTEPVPVPKGSASQDPNAHKQQVVLPPGYQAMDVPVKRGSVVFIHGHMVHASNKNASMDFRRALLMTYVRRGEHFRPGNTAKRSEVDVYTKS